MLSKSGHSAIIYANWRWLPAVIQEGGKWISTFINSTVSILSPRRPKGPLRRTSMHSWSGSGHRPRAKSVIQADPDMGRWASHLMYYGYQYDGTPRSAKIGYDGGNQHGHDRGDQHGAEQDDDPAAAAAAGGHYRADGDQADGAKHGQHGKAAPRGAAPAPRRVSAAGRHRDRRPVNHGRGLQRRGAAAASGG